MTKDINEVRAEFVALARQYQSEYAIVYSIKQLGLDGHKESAAGYWTPDLREPICLVGVVMEAAEGLYRKNGLNGVADFLKTMRLRMENALPWEMTTTHSGEIRPS